MKEYREKKKDIIQLSNKEYYKIKMKISMKVNCEMKRKNYVDKKDAKQKRLATGRRDFTAANRHVTTKNFNAIKSI